MVFYDWSSEIEAQILSKSHVGIMPLDNDDFSKGKSAFKLIQYMSCGLPLVASSVGENNNVVKNGRNGFLVKNEIEWIESI
jgi:glycosyltransferase involved in cell wall biosynthesis